MTDSPTTQILSLAPETLSHIIALVPQSSLHILLKVSHLFFHLAIRRFFNLTASLHSILPGSYLPSSPDPSVSDWLASLFKKRSVAARWLSGDVVSASRFDFHCVKGMEMRDGLIIVAGKHRDWGPSGVYWTPYVDNEIVVPQLLGGRTWDEEDTSSSHQLVGRIINRDNVAIGQGGRLFLERLETLMTEELAWPTGLWDEGAEIMVVCITSSEDRLAAIASAGERAFLVVWEWTRTRLICSTPLGPHKTYSGTHRKYYADFVHPLLIHTALEDDSERQSHYVHLPLRAGGLATVLPVGLPHRPFSQNPPVRYWPRLEELDFVDPDLASPFGEIMRGGFTADGGWIQPHGSSVIPYEPSILPDSVYSAYYQVSSASSGYRTLLSNRFRNADGRPRGDWERYYIWETSPPLVRDNVDLFLRTSNTTNLVVHEASLAEPPLPVSLERVPIPLRDENQDRNGGKVLGEIKNETLLAFLRQTEGLVTLEDKGERLAVVLRERVIIFQV